MFETVIVNISDCVYFDIQYSTNWKLITPYHFYGFTPINCFVHPQCIGGRVEVNVVHKDNDIKENG